MKKRPTTDERRRLLSELSEKFGKWDKMDDATLLAEVKAVFPAIVSATRNECYKMLVMTHVDKMVGD